VKKLLTIGLLFGSVCLAKAQDLHFSQFYESALLRNPSLAGLFEGDVRVQIVYRDQWNSFTNAYKTGSLNAQYKMPVGSGNDYLTAGLQMLFDKAGTAGLTSTHLMPAINYHTSLSSEKPMYISVGFMGGWVQKRIDRSKITTNSQFDGTAYNPALADGEAFINPGYSYADASVGASFNSSFGQEQQHVFFAGLAYHHLNRPRNTFYRTAGAALNPKWVLSGGAKVMINEQSFFTMQGDLSRQGSAQEVIAGALYGWKFGDFPEDPDYVLQLGTLVRWKDAIIPVVKLDYRPFSVGISYDVNISPLRTVSMGRGGFELSVVYTGFLDRDNTTRDKVLCPTF
jgi:type IX secretion system PorP/SprF family membrane protein